MTPRQRVAATRCAGRKALRRRDLSTATILVALLASRRSLCTFALSAPRPGAPRPPVPHEGLTVSVGPSAGPGAGSSLGATRVDDIVGWAAAHA